jgi:hypothetical protein
MYSGRDILPSLSSCSLVVNFLLVQQSLSCVIKKVKTFCENKVPLGFCIL